MARRSIRMLLGVASLALTAAVTVPMSAAQATSPTEAEVKGEVGIERIIPGRCEYTNSEPTVRLGSSGAAVRQAQCEYNWSTRGDNIAEDGQFGPITDQAIRRFQSCVGIGVDGIVGPVTWSHLNFWAASSGYPPNC